MILGGHYDTVPGVPGANDNGSGIAALMTIASEVSDRSYPFTLRFIGFGAEEIGLYGSRFHVESLSEDDLDGVIAMFNFDALGTGRAAGVLGDSCSGAVDARRGGGRTASTSRSTGHWEPDGAAITRPSRTRAFRCCSSSPTTSHASTLQRTVWSSCGPSS